jgi:hypothetical protein
MNAQRRQRPANRADIFESKQGWSCWPGCKGVGVLEFSRERDMEVWWGRGTYIEYKAVLRVRVEINKINDVTVEQPPAKTGAWSYLVKP